MQVSIERGFKAGIALVAGQWVSDYIYIGIAFFGAGYMQALQQDAAFKQQLTIYLGALGAIFLAILGLTLLLSVPKKGAEHHINKKSKIGFLIQGFLINTLTPFPIFFWLSLMSTAIGRGLGTADSIWLFTGVMLAVMFTDVLKVYAAKKISLLMNARYVLLVRKMAGLALILSGIGLLIYISFPI